MATSALEKFRQAKASGSMSNILAKPSVSKPTVTQPSSASVSKPAVTAPSTVSVQANGKAPTGLSVGSTVKTGGGDYKITAVNPDGSYKSEKVTQPTAGNSVSNTIKGILGSLGQIGSAVAQKVSDTAPKKTEMDNVVEGVYGEDYTKDNINDALIKNNTTDIDTKYNAQINAVNSALLQKINALNAQRSSVNSAYDLGEKDLGYTEAEKNYQMREDLNRQNGVVAEGLAGDLANKVKIAMAREKARLIADRINGLNKIDSDIANASIDSANNLVTLNSNKALEMGNLNSKAYLDTLNTYMNVANNANSQNEKIKDDYQKSIAGLGDQFDYGGEIDELSKDNDASNDWKIPILKQEREKKIQANLERDIKTATQYSDDYDDQIQKRTLVNPNDPMIPYLKVLRMDKVEAQKKADASVNAELYKRYYDIFTKVTGIVANDEMAKVLGIPKGTTTLDYLKTKYDINKPYYNPNGGGSGSDDEGMTASQILSGMKTRSDEIIADYLNDPVKGKHMNTAGSLERKQASAQIAQEAYAMGMDKISIGQLLREKGLGEFAD